MMSDERRSQDLLSERFRNIKEFLQISAEKTSFSSFITHHSSFSSFSSPSSLIILHSSLLLKK